MKLDSGKEFKIGEIIKSMVLKKGISSKAVAQMISRSVLNADKIYRMVDMDIEDIIRISYLLEYNILHFLVTDYLPHLSNSIEHIETEPCLLKVDINKRCIICNESVTNCNFLADTHIGEHIKKVANKNNWNGIEVAALLHCTPSMVSHLYRCKSLKVKKIMQISEAFQYDFISNLYLPQIIIANSLNFLEDCTITVCRQNIRITNPSSNICMLFSYQNNAKI
jgi:transcriptional regulator with XRE-family HTH domain